MPSKPSEFDLINRYFEGLTFSHRSKHNSELHVGDDCALLSVPAGKALAVSVDTMVEGVHFPKAAPPNRLAERVLGAALSDLAAMAADPAFVTLSLSLPESDEAWLEGFSAGLKKVLSTYGIDLVGGDTTRGPLTIGVQVHGYVEANRALRRDKAEVGDLVVVTGTLGDAGAALDLLCEPTESLIPDQTYLLDRYYAPTPRFKEAELIAPFASACIDISDGLLADARHIAQRSGVEIEIDVDRLPISSSLRQLYPKASVELALSSGDDYELLFTISEKAWDTFKRSPGMDNFSVIGKIAGQGADVRMLKNGKVMAMKQEGYKHFE